MGSDQAGAANLKYLLTATEVFQKWRNSRNNGFTSQSFTVCIQTISAFPKISKHLQSRHGFLYILPGKFTSDPIKSRFGWYRQVNGDNYFMSIKQLLEAEKKIRVFSLFCSSNLMNLDILPLKHVDMCNVASENLLWLVEFFSNAPADELSSTDANVTYFVSGYVGRSVSCRRKCPYKSLLVSGHKPLSLHECVAKDY